MSVSESSPLASNLQESIEHLIAETVRRSHEEHEQEKVRLRKALQQALTEVEAGQSALTRAADLLRAALDAPDSVAEVTPLVKPSAIEPIKEEVESTPEPPAVSAPEIAADENTDSAVAEPTGPHEMDIVAHNINFRVAGHLQKWLNDRPEVNNLKTRTYVGNELHLELKLESGIDLPALKQWMTEHGGSLATSTDSVLELRFGD